jgi:hypothetical protein
MPQATSTFQPPRREHDALALSLDRLRQALAADVPGHQREWSKRVGDALARVETALRQHRAVAKAPDGLLAQVDETRPTLARQADELRSDHDDFLVQVRALREQVRRTVEAFTTSAALSAKTRAGGVADFGAIRRHADQLLSGLQQNKDAETQLVLESVNTDIGVGD